jgi:hypothetical protein
MNEKQSLNETPVDNTPRGHEPTSDLVRSGAEQRMNEKQSVSETPGDNRGHDPDLALKRLRFVSEQTLTKKFIMKEILLDNKTQVLKYRSPDVVVAEIVERTPAKFDNAGRITTNENGKMNPKDDSHLTNYRLKNKITNALSVTYAEASSAFGHRLTNLLQYAEGVKAIKQYTHDAVKNIRNAENIPGANDNYKDSAKLFGDMYYPAAELSMHTLTRIMDISDVFQMFIDPLFPQFPDITSFASPSSFQNLLNIYFKRQIDAIKAENQNINILNSAETNKLIADNNYIPTYKPHGMFPLISGPLEVIDEDKGPYWNQMRVNSELDAVREKLLSDPSTTFYSLAVPIKTDNPDYSLLYISSLFTLEQQDELFRQAYSNVCTYYNGTVYEDLHPETDIYWKGRPRFQCGWSTQTDCLKQATKFFNLSSTAGNYAEWFLPADINSYLSSDVTDTTACQLSSLDTTLNTYKTACNFYDYSTGQIPAVLSIPNGGTAYNDGTCRPIITGGGGNGAVISVVFQSGTAKSVVVNNRGTAYNSAPTIDFSPCGDGTGASISGFGFKITKPKNSNFQNGICSFTNMSIRGSCQTTMDENGNPKPTGAVYNPIDHSCTYTPEFCRSIGSCYNNTTKFCELPAEILFGLSFIFGTAGPREWIKHNGCNFTGTQEQVLSLLGPLGLTTKFGISFASDLLANHNNWKNGLKKTLEDPIMATALTQMALIPTLNMFGATSTVAALETPIVAVNAARYPLLARITPSYLTVIFMVTMAVEIGVQMASVNVSTGMSIPDQQVYPGNYTVGGWMNGDPTKPPIALGFYMGWVTKPISAHAPATMVAGAPVIPPPISVSQLTGSLQQTFYDTNATNDINGQITAAYTGIAIASLGIYAAVTSLSDYRNNCNNVVTPVRTYTGVRESAHKNVCHTSGMIYGGGNSECNKMWCIPPFPGDIYTDKINIGSLVPSSTSSTQTYLTSNTWTDGSDPYTAFYPIDEVISKNNNTSQGQVNWKYQLSYDKENMVGMVGTNGNLGQLSVSNGGRGYTPNAVCNLVFTGGGGSLPVGTAQVNANGSIASAQITHAGSGNLLPINIEGVTNCGNGTSFIIGEVPLYLWSDAVLMTYFDRVTINEMRQTYCTRMFQADNTGKTVDPKCWGYFSIRLTSYLFNPMSIPGKRV